MVDVSLSSAIVILLLVMDPVGNVPFFVTLMKGVPKERRKRVILRECAIAYVVLVVFAFFGRQILDLLGLSDVSLNIAGGVILFIIALRLVFRHPEGIFGDDVHGGEPFIVPLAIPAIAGPTAIATVVLLVAGAPERVWEWVGALTIACGINLLIMFFADQIGHVIGSRGLAALERLMGLLLTAIAVQMLLKGIEAFVKQLA
ncbi:MAG TPA: MarC family protein [Burkholderiales bacterium]|nr:MarC family protein [Burkholderiales bacterium]